MADLKIWTGAMGGESIEDGFDRQKAALWAEDIAARKALGIEEAPGHAEGDEDVAGRTTHIGDYHQTPPVVVVNESKPILGTILATALAVGLPGAGLLGFGIAKMIGDQAEKVIIEKGKDTSMTLGLKRIGDLDLGE